MPGDRFADRTGQRFDLDVGAHALQDVDDPGAGRVDPDPVDHDLGTGNDRGGNEEEGGRGNVGRNLDLVQLKVGLPGGS